MAPSDIAAGKKRKRAETVSASAKPKSDKSGQKSQKPSTKSSSEEHQVAASNGELTTPEEILELEEAIVASQRNYNGIVTLLTCFQEFNDPELGVTAAVSLCRTFCRLMAKGRMTKRKTDSEAEVTIYKWLKDRYKDYVSQLGEVMKHGEDVVQTTALTLSMRLLKEEGTHLKGADEDHYFPHDLMARIAQAVLYTDSEEDKTLQQEFIEKYLNAYHDVRYSFLHVAVNLIQEAAQQPELDRAVFRANMVNILLNMQNLPVDLTEYEMSPFYIIDEKLRKKKKNQKPPPIALPSAHRKQLAEVWLLTMKLNLIQDEQKTVLDAMTHKIVPFFAQPQLLMDFLTDCYDTGGVMSLLALNGLFELIKSKNLDYPNFFTKLYALFDRNLMHVRYRSRFFRLVETFLSSTHLPAILIASFIKRMARLSLSAPPSAIVIVIPLIYNLLKMHPSCTFMVHREYYDRDAVRITGMDDPFNNDEPDPMNTGALDSCLWEIETLQSHYHPSVATLARIISEQFTKHQYAVEDFLDHSYASMIDTELKKTLKKDPVVEYEVPKRIFTIPEASAEEAAAETDGEVAKVGSARLLADLWAF